MSVCDEVVTRQLKEGKGITHTNVWTNTEGHGLCVVCLASLREIIRTNVTAVGRTKTTLEVRRS